MASITIVVGAGLPGHATIQINRGEKTTYLGLGPKNPGEVKDIASYDIVTLEKGVPRWRRCAIRSLAIKIRKIQASITISMRSSIK